MPARDLIYTQGLRLMETPPSRRTRLKREDTTEKSYIGKELFLPESDTLSLGPLAILIMWSCPNKALGAAKCAW